MRYGQKTRVSTSVSGWLPQVLPVPLSLKPILWLDADDASTITSSSGKVSQWNDKSGNAYNGSQSTSTLQPTTGSTTLNGRNVFTFSSSRISTPAFTYTQYVDVFCVVRSSVTDTANRQFFGNDTTTPTVYMLNGYWAMYAGTVLQSTTLVNTSAHLVTARFNAGTGTLRLDGTEIKTGSVNTNGWNNKKIHIGTDSGSSFWSGDIAEVIVCPTLTATGLADVENYLNAKWAIY